MTADFLCKQNQVQSIKLMQFRRHKIKETINYLRNYLRIQKGYSGSNFKDLRRKDINKKISTMRSIFPGDMIEILSLETFQNSLGRIAMNLQ